MEQLSAVSAMFVPIGNHIAEPLQSVQPLCEPTRSVESIIGAVAAELMIRRKGFVRADGSNPPPRPLIKHAGISRLTPAPTCDCGDLTLNSITCREDNPRMAGRAPVPVQPSRQRPADAH